MEKLGKPEQVWNKNVDEEVINRILNRVSEQDLNAALFGDTEFTEDLNKILRRPINFEGSTVTKEQYDLFRIIIGEMRENGVKMKEASDEINLHRQQETTPDTIAEHMAEEQKLLYKYNLLKKVDDMLADQIDDILRAKTQKEAYNLNLN